MHAAKSGSSHSVVRRPLLAAAMAASAVAPSPAMAAYDVFLKLDGVYGESTQAKFDKWIQLLSYSTGVETTLASQGTASGRAIGKSSCSEFRFTKTFDRASPTLLAAVVTGQHFKNAQVYFVHTGEAGGGVFLKYELEDVIVSSLQDMSAQSSDNAPLERVAFNFGGITVSYYMQNPDGGGSGDPTAAASISCP